MSDNLAKGLQRWYPVIVLVGSALISIGFGKASAAYVQAQVSQNSHDIVDLRKSDGELATTLARIEERVIAIQERLNRRDTRDTK